MQEFMPKGDTLPTCLLSLSVTEHAVLINRFKFLKLVQRVAAADVAEMIQTVGLDALSYKGVLQKVQLPCPLSETARGRGSEPVGIDTHRGTPQPRRGGLHAAADSSIGAPRRRRFPTREKELQFVERMAQPHHRSNPIKLYLQKPPRGRRAETPQFPSRSPSRHQGRRAGTAALGFTDGNNDYGTSPAVRVGDNSDDEHQDDMSDAVMVDTSDELLQLQNHEQQHKSRFHKPIARVVPPFPTKSGVGREIGRDASQTMVSTESPSVSEKRGSASLFISEGVKTAKRCENEPSMYRQMDTQNCTSIEVRSPLALHGSARGRGSFAPKAKPKAAATVSRVPMEVIRHASALLTNRGAIAQLPTPPPPPQGPLPVPPAAPNSGSWERQSTEFACGVSQSQPLLPPALRFSKRGESENQHGRTPPEFSPPMWSNDAIAELTSCVERMLQDHHAILEGIVKDEDEQPPNVPKIKRRVEKAGRGGVSEPLKSTNNSGKTIPGRESTSVNYLTELDTVHRSRREYGMLDEFSDDEDDEMLLVSRLQRQVGAMDHELKAIERREESKGILSEEEEEGRVLRAAASSKRSSRCVVIDDRKVNRKGGSGRRGEIPRAIVERLRSFQKEIHEYIRYTEMLWNTSNVTEQVFAQRLTESLAEDAFQEVLEELGNILDTYVDGLVLHELQ